MGESGVGARRRTLAARRCGGRGPVAEVVLRVPGSEVSTREAPAGILEGSGGFEVAGGEEIAEASRLTRDGTPGKSRLLQVMGSCGEASGSFLGLRRSRSGGLQGLGHVGAAWPRRSRGAARGGAAQARRARVTAAARAWMMGYGGGQGLLIGRRPT